MNVTMKANLSKKEKFQSIRFALMDCTTEQEVFDLIEKEGAIFDMNQDAVEMFAKRLATIEQLEDEKRKSHRLYMN